MLAKVAVLTVLVCQMYSPLVGAETIYPWSSSEGALPNVPGVSRP